MLFYSYFKTLVGQEVTVELKNDLAITGEWGMGEGRAGGRVFLRARVRSPGIATARQPPPAITSPLSLSLSLSPHVPHAGRLHSVDQYLNIKLSDVRQQTTTATGPSGAAAVPPSPALASVRNAFIRGSVVRYVVLPASGVDTELLHDATRREARGSG
jgi:U6 snRNA-associated Sm-like protein LSm2